MQDMNSPTTILMGEYGRPNYIAQKGRLWIKTG
jgi:hypothetical protein